MTQDDCRLYETCSAPLCPLDRASLQNGIWYPDEEICRSRTFGNLTWIRQQGKIAKSAPGRTDTSIQRCCKGNASSKRGSPDWIPTRWRSSNFRSGWMTTRKERNSPRRKRRSRGNGPKRGTSGKREVRNGARIRLRQRGAGPVFKTAPCPWRRGIFSSQSLGFKT